MFVAACSSGGSSSGSVPLSDLKSRAIAADCELETRCGGYPDVASCQGSVTNSVDQLIAGVNAGRIEYDGNAAAACLAVLAKLGCDLTEQPANEPRACAGVFKGTVPATGTCYVDQDCQSGAPAMPIFVTGPGIA